ncbi:recombinase family protein [Aliarcobacter cibarius]|uniref:Resolvase n=1 Tax=Aliarcobacter cibarius TaxID=255507 RepID=A0A7L5JQ91_9BACT|nr:recombinase family protein [Aliarcobacter cibarius]QKJ27423.1 resolvase [Aliarcobacter cibarius]TLT04314.1 resolvase [Aliarcobacter cibarius]
MSKIFTYIRKNLNNDKYTQEQEEAISNYVSKKKLQIYKNVEIIINTPKDEKNILQLLENCEKNSMIIVTNLNVFGRTIDTILEIVKFLLQNKIRIIVIEQNLDLIDDKDMLSQMILSVISMTVNLEKELMSLRTKEALTAKKLDGIALGKPKGTIQKSKFDEQREKIEELLGVGLSVRKIAKLLGYNNHIGLNNYVRKRNIKQQVNQSSDS